MITNEKLNQDHLFHAYNRATVYTYLTPIVYGPAGRRARKECCRAEVRSEFLEIEA